MYVGNDDSKLYAFKSDVTPRWKYFLGNINDHMLFSAPTIGADGTVYVGSTDSYLYAIGSTATLKWKYQTGSLSLRPQLSELMELST